MAGRSWEEIPQESWENITLRVNDEGDWFVRFGYEGRNGIHYDYPEEAITFDEFLYIYDLAGDLDQGLEIEY